MEIPNTQISVLGPLGRGEHYKTTKERDPDKTDPFIPYWRIAKPMTNRPGRKTVTTEDMENLSKVGHWFFWRLNSIRNEHTNIAEFTPKDASEKKQVGRAYKELYDLGMVIRKRRQHYMMNPEIFLTWSGCHNEALKEWNKLVKAEEIHYELADKK